MFVFLAAILYVIAGAMILMGGYVASDGSQMLVVDRGVAYYIGGMSLLSGGAVLLGIATLVLSLGFLNRTLKQARTQIVAQADAQADVHAHAEPASFGMMPAPAMPVAPAMSPSMADTVYEDAREYRRDRVEPLPVPMLDTGDRDAAPALAVRDIDAAMDNVRHRNTYSYAPEEPAAEPAVAEADTDASMHRSAFGYYSNMSPGLSGGGGYVEQSPVEQQYPVEQPYPVQADDRIDPYARHPEEIEVAAPVAETRMPAAAASHEAAAPVPPVTVVGSYESGGNYYVMYSDGSIEAHLPSGVRTFLSLDELKQFVTASSAA